MFYSVYICPMLLNCSSEQITTKYYVYFCTNVGLWRHAAASRTYSVRVNWDSFGRSVYKICMLLHINYYKLTPRSMSEGPLI